MPVTNAIDSLHMRLRRIIEARAHFSADEAARKRLWLALRNVTAEWSRGDRGWRSAINHLALLYPGRFTRAAV